ncbi:hypothetical protein B0H19DRAFT_1369218 [Mycena capillaripes]|nr:hypothetical protein B0H19DRAFT_1369218 [Mycena capillaripes]
MEATKELWRPTNLSIILPDIHKSVDDLKRFLQDKGVDITECNRNFKDLEGEINTLVQAFSLHTWPKGADSNSPFSIMHLSEDARRTLWDNVPICAIANAHKKEADFLTTQGGPLCEIYIEYAKYLLLHPRSNEENEDSEYTEVFRKVHMLESFMQDVSSVSTS